MLKLMIWSHIFSSLKFHDFLCQTIEAGRFQISSAGYPKAPVPFIAKNNR